ncbi:MAG: hypothetical protein ACI8XO_002278 [Verrucomicrobiales bacterium]|jgi:hypothetical protein
MNQPLDKRCPRHRHCSLFSVGDSLQPHNTADNQFAAGGDASPYPSETFNNAPETVGKSHRRRRWRNFDFKIEEQCPSMKSEHDGLRF